MLWRNHLPSLIINPFRIPYHIVIFLNVCHINLQSILSHFSNLTFTPFLFLRHMDLEKLHTNTANIDGWVWQLLWTWITKSIFLLRYYETIWRFRSMRSIKIKRALVPTEEARTVMRHKDLSFLWYKIYWCKDNCNRYMTTRNRCNQVICNAKHWHILQNIVHSFFSVWKFLGTPGIDNKQHPEFKNIICVNDIYRYFSSTTTLYLHIKYQTLSYI